MPKLIILNGSNGSSKDTFADIVAEFTPTINWSSVDKVREDLNDENIVYKHFGVKEKSNYSKEGPWRQRMVELKRIYTLEENEMPFTDLCNVVSREEDKLIFAHVREPYNIAKIQRYFQESRSLLISRKDQDIADTTADRNGELYGYDLYISNNGNLEELRLKARNFALYVEKELEKITIDHSKLDSPFIN